MGLHVMVKISIINRQNGVPLDRVQLRRAARRVLDGENVSSAEIGLVFVNDEHIASLNKQFLNHDGPTDVISFPYSEPGGQPLVGEIVISTETAERAAQEMGCTIQEELELYTIHGVLHFCGYDDQSEPERAVMRAKELEYQKTETPPESGASV